MTKTYTHRAIYFASALFLSMSIGAISPAHADAARPVTVPKLQKKAPKVVPVIEEVVEVEAEKKPKRTVFVRRRKDPVVAPRAKPSANGDGLEFAEFGGNEEFAAENADNEVSSTVGIDTVSTATVVLDKDQPKDANLSAASASESAADADELALLKAEITALKAQLLSEKKNSAKLTVDLVRPKEKASAFAKTEQEASAKPAVEANDAKTVEAEVKEPEAAQAELVQNNETASEEVSATTDVVADTEVVAETKEVEAAKVEDLNADELKEAEIKDIKIEAAESDVKAPAISELVGDDTTKLVDATKEAVTTPKTAAEIAADAGAKIAAKGASEKAAETTRQITAPEEEVAQSTDAELAGAKLAAPSSPKAETEAKTTAATAAEIKPKAEQSASAEKKDTDAEKIAQEDKTAEPKETKLALAPTNPKSPEEPIVAPDLDAANATLAEGAEVAEIDPALLFPRPRENPFPRVVPKVAKGPLYIKLPPVNDTYNMYVLGDSLGSGLWQGLHQNFRGGVAPSVKVVKKAKANTGIVRSDRFDWMENIEKISNGGGFQIAVMMFGANDAQTIRAKGKRHHFGTPAWEQIYRQRIDRMVRALKRKKVAIYWVGLPNVRIPSLRKNYDHFNAIFKEKADEHGFHFIETWDVTNDASGKWQSSGKTVRGKKAVLRAKDGTHFTSSGYRVLAQFPEKIMRPDINQARANRLAKGLRIKGTDG